MLTRDNQEEATRRWLEHIAWQHRTLAGPSGATWIGTMSKAEILAELPKLKAEERRQFFERLCELQERDLLQGHGPSPEEKTLLDQALAEFEHDGQRGEPWRDVLRRLQASRPR